MSPLNQLLLVLGLFIVPLCLLLLGHKVKRAAPRRQRVFWGALAGHVIAGVVALAVSLMPPIGWLPSDVLRGALGVWSLVLLPFAGALIAAFLPTEPAR